MGRTKTDISAELGQSDSRVIEYDARRVLVLDFVQQTFDARRAGLGQTRQRPGPQPDIFAGE